MTDIRCGDCLEMFPAVADGSVDACVCDPPFGVNFSYDLYKDNLDASAYIGWSMKWMAEASRVLKPTGSLFIFIGDEYAADLRVIAERELGLHPRNWLIWSYAFGTHQKRKFGRCKTHLHYLTKHPKDFTFNADAVRVPSARQTKYNDKRANPLGRVPGDVWDFPRVCGTFKERIGGHGCQMPEAILGRIIRACTNEGDTVLDPFLGTGTTAAVAKKLGRRCIGFELSPNYATIAGDRVASVRAGDALANE